ncbi:MAG: uncharacterized membrane-anchored protein YhcB (DUF1043 family), partial [Alpinimonas sp.]
MKNIFWLIVGVAVGFVIAHRVSKSEQGQAFLSDMDSKSRDFKKAIIEGYRLREEELRS